MNIYQKLLEIQKRIMGLGKDGKSYGYNYVTGTKVLEHLKPLMNEFGLLLKQEVLSIHNSRQDYNAKAGAKSEILTKAMMRFTWIDCETGETDVNLFGANGQNDWEKGLGSACTYGERIFLLKYFHISTDEDDVDNPERKTTQPIKEAKQAPQQQPKQEQPVSPSKEENAADQIIPATNRQKETLQKLLNNPVITSQEKATGLTKISTYTEEKADKVIRNLNKVIADREAEQNGAPEVAAEPAGFQK